MRGKKKGRWWETWGQWALSKLPGGNSGPGELDGFLEQKTGKV